MEQLQAIAKVAKSYKDETNKKGPQNDDELHEWCIKNVGIDIPRVAVCKHADPPHVAPFTFLADLYFERVGSALAMANRGGSKTFIVALLHFINSLFKPECESLTFGAVESQSDRAYAHMRGFIYDKEGNKIPEIVFSKMKETKFKNNAKVEILGSTPEQVNGPHPQKAHADEIELMRDDTWSESRNMVIGKTTSDGVFIRPQDILTSTRKGPRGRMQLLIDEIQESLAQGDEPAYTFYPWCVWECAHQVTNCREAPENKGKPEEELCQCNKVRKDVWDDLSPRFLNEVCGGKLYRSRGWKPYDDIKNTFQQNARVVWEAQQECSRPSTENLYLPKFDKGHHGIKNYLPNPGYGSIYTSVDWGGTNPHSVHWYQLLNYNITVLGYDGEKKIIPEGTLVCFDEIYETQLSATKLGNLVHSKEDKYRERFPDWKVEARFADPQGKLARNEWKTMDRPLKTVWYTTRDFEIHITYINDLFADDRFRIDLNKCRNWVNEALDWKRDPNTGNQIDKFNHAMSDFRYCLANLRRMTDRLTDVDNPVAKTKESLDNTTPSADIPVVLGNKSATRQPETWRGRFASAQPQPPFVIHRP